MGEGLRGARRGHRGKAMGHYQLPAEPGRQSAPRAALRAPPPPPRAISDAGSVQAHVYYRWHLQASLLNPVSNGYQHRASNVIRPAALPHHCAGSPGARARARPGAAAPARVAQAGRSRATVPRSRPGSMTHC